MPAGKHLGHICVCLVAKNAGLVKDPYGICNDLGYDPCGLHCKSLVADLFSTGRGPQAPKRVKKINFTNEYTLIRS